MFIIKFLLGIIKWIVVYPILYVVFIIVQGWQFVGSPPDAPKIIGAIAPHTSNLDTVLMIFAAWYFRQNALWFGKEELFEIPIFGTLCREAGGIPVDRDKPLLVMKRTIKTIKEQDEFILGIAVDGTRKKTDHWKKGYYYIAQKTSLPVVYVRLDYGTRTITFSEPQQITGDADADLDNIRPFFDGVQGKNPENASDIRFI